jgi:tetratricopeptide (TPR) repeat protein
MEMGWLALLLTNLAVMQIQLEEFEPAQVNLEKALALSPRDREALFNLGLIYERHHHDDAKAAEYLQQFRAVAPDAPQSEQVRDWLRRYDTNRNAVARAAAAEPTAAVVDEPSGSTEAEPPPQRRAPEPPELGEIPVARTVDRRPEPPAVVDPDGPLDVALFRGLTDAEDYEAVLRRFGEARKNDPDYGFYCFYAGLAQLEKKDTAAAVALLKEAVKRHPDAPDHLLQLGWALHARGDGEGARKLPHGGDLRRGRRGLSEPLTEDRREHFVGVGRLDQGEGSVLSERDVSGIRLAQRELQDIAVVGFVDAGL